MPLPEPELLELPAPVPELPPPAPELPVLVPELPVFVPAPPGVPLPTSQATSSRDEQANDAKATRRMRPQ